MVPSYYLYIKVILIKVIIVVLIRGNTPRVNLLIPFSQVTFTNADVLCTKILYLARCSSCLHASWPFVSC